MYEWEIGNKREQEKILVLEYLMLSWFESQWIHVHTYWWGKTSISRRIRKFLIRKYEIIFTYQNGSVNL